MSDKEFSMSRAFGDATRLFREQAALYVGIALVFALPAELFDLIMGEEGLGSVIVSLLIIIIFGAAAEAAITVGALRQSGAGSPSDSLNASNLVAEGLNFYAAVLVAYLIIMVLFTIGVIFLIIPGVIVLTLFFFAVPAIIAEKTNGLSGLERSMAVAKGVRLEVFIMVFLFIIAMLGINWTLEVLFAGAPLIAAFTTWIADAILGAYGIVLAVTGYLQLAARQGASEGDEPDGEA